MNEKMEKLKILGLGPLRESIKVGVRKTLCAGGWVVHVDEKMEKLKILGLGPLRESIKVG